MPLRKGDAITFGPLVTSSDHITDEVAVTASQVTVTLLQPFPGAPLWLPPNGALTAVGNGFFRIAPNPLDTGIGGIIALHATAPGCDNFDMTFQVEPCESGDSIGVQIVAQLTQIVGLLSNILTRKY